MEEAGQKEEDELMMMMMMMMMMMKHELPKGREPEMRIKNEEVFEIDESAT